jgi:hypothetical protein
VYSDFCETLLLALRFEKTEEINIDNDDQEFNTEKGTTFQNNDTRHPSHQEKLQTNERRTMLKETTCRKMTV